MGNLVRFLGCFTETNKSPLGFPLGPRSGKEGGGKPGGGWGWPFPLSLCLSVSAPVCFPLYLSHPVSASLHVCLPASCPFCPLVPGALTGHPTGTVPGSEVEAGPGRGALRAAEARRRRRGGETAGRRSELCGAGSGRHLQALRDAACGAACWGGVRALPPPSNRRDLPPLNRFSFAQRPELKAFRPAAA